MPTKTLLASIFVAGMIGCGGPSTAELENQKIEQLIATHGEAVSAKLERISQARAVVSAVETLQPTPVEGLQFNIPFSHSGEDAVDTSAWNALLMGDTELKYVHEVVTGATPADQRPPEDFGLYADITNRIPHPATTAAQCLHDGWRDQYFHAEDVHEAFDAVRQAEHVLVLREMERVEPGLNGTAAFTPGSVLCGAFLVRIEDGAIVGVMPFSSTNDAQLDYATDFGDGQIHDARGKLYANLQEKLETDFHAQAQSFLPGVKLAP